MNPRIPQDIISHCEKHSMCKGCPLGTCVAPVSDHHFNDWLSRRITEIRSVIGGAKQ
jgi:hypothetical protein